MAFGLYIHLPFCAAKCYYCDFPSFAGKDFWIKDYCRALVLEAANSPAIGRHIDTVYWGGGSPSYLSPTDFENIWKYLSEFFYFYQAREKTIEVNPGEVSPDILLFWKEELSINRISIGLQIADDEILRNIGRRYSFKDFLAAYEMIRKYFDNVNIDLIYGLPQTTEEIWLASLKSVVSLRPEHISLYPLELSPETVLARSGFQIDEDHEAHLYKIGVEFLTQSGWRHYEISNFSLPGYECQHNLNYWRQGEYLGLGVGAASFIRRYRWKNVSDLDEYLRAILKNDFSGLVAEKEYLNSDNLFRERLILGLRLEEGVTIKKIEWQEIKDNLKESQKYNLLEFKVIPPDRVCLRLTPSGKFLSNIVFREII